ncbi:MAG: protein kinase [Deltaproteobacteria bacterium]|nr:protein kinase [Deltaproteobacteria bacterium]
MSQPQPAAQPQPPVSQPQPAAQAQAASAPSANVGGSAAIQRQDPLVGTLVDGRYQVIAPIAEGGMGRVYRAHHQTANRTVALKVLTGDCAPQHKDVREARFLREARVISGLAHPNVVQVYDFGVLPNGELYYVMEFIAGEPLADIVFDDAPMPVSRVTQLGLQMAAGLQAAHEQGIVHRDLKPENVIVVEQNGEQVAKVVDFGIAKILGDTGKKLTRTGIVTGTPHYISPEQARAGELDTRSDVYSFGVMLYEMAVGKLPFDVDDESWVALLEAHIRQQPPPPSAHGVDIGPLEGIILRCLEKHPDARFQSMAELAAALERPETAPRYTPAPYVPDANGPPHVRPSTIPASALPMRKVPRAVWLAGVAVLAVLLGVGGWWLTTMLREREPVPATTALPAPTPQAPRATESDTAPAPRPTGPTTHLVSEPPGAEVTLDGVVLGNTPLDVRLPLEGSQMLRLTLPDHFPVEHTIDAASPGEWSVTLRHRPAPRRARATEPVAQQEAPAMESSVTESPRIRIEEPINPWAD